MLSLSTVITYYTFILIFFKFLRHSCRHFAFNLDIWTHYGFSISILFVSFSLATFSFSILFASFSFVGTSEYSFFTSGPLLRLASPLVFFLLINQYPTPPATTTIKTITTAIMVPEPPSSPTLLFVTSSFASVLFSLFVLTSIVSSFVLWSIVGDSWSPGVVLTSTSVSPTSFGEVAVALTSWPGIVELLFWSSASSGNH